MTDSEAWAAAGAGITARARFTLEFACYDLGWTAVRFQLDADDPSTAFGAARRWAGTGGGPPWPPRAPISRSPRSMPWTRARSLLARRATSTRTEAHRKCRSAPSSATRTLSPSRPSVAIGRTRLPPPALRYSISHRTRIVSLVAYVPRTYRSVARTARACVSQPALVGTLPDAIASFNPFAPIR